MKLTPEQNELLKRVDEILWEDWDPYGLKNSAPRDEYSSYALTVFSKAYHGGTVEEIAEKLYNLINDGDFSEEEYKQHCLKVARKIKESQEEFKKK